MLLPCPGELFDRDFNSVARVRVLDVEAAHAFSCDEGMQRSGARRIAFCHRADVLVASLEDRVDDRKILIVCSQEDLQRAKSVLLSVAEGGGVTDALREGLSLLGDLRLEILYLLLLGSRLTQRGESIFKSVDLTQKGLSLKDLRFNLRHLGRRVAFWATRAK